jgi:hypothetical protein
VKKASIAPLASGMPVAAIIPAHNEGGLILNILEVLHQDDSLSEIIVIDDGSTDDTVEKSSSYSQIDPRVKVLQHDVNQGKGQAVITGWRASQAPILLLLDADLIGLKKSHIRCLIQPVLEDRVDMSVGLFRGGQLFTDLAHRVTPWLSGQRCLKAALLESVSMEAAAGYGIETAISITAKYEQWRCCNVFLAGVSHPPSEIHRGFWEGIRVRARMYGEILRAWWIIERQKPHRYPIKSKSSTMIFFFLSLSGLGQVLDSLRTQIQSIVANLWKLILGSFQQILVFLPHLDPFTLVRNSYRHSEVSGKLVIASADPLNSVSWWYVHGSRSTVQTLSCLPDFTRSLIRVVLLFLDNGFREIPHLSDVISVLSRL